MSSLEELFCSVDDFCERFEPLWRKQLLMQGRQRDTLRCLRAKSPDVPERASRRF